MRYISSNPASLTAILDLLHDFRFVKQHSEVVLHTHFGDLLDMIDMKDIPRSGMWGVTFSNKFKPFL